MNQKQIEAYEHDKNFERNQAIWVLAKIDRLDSQEIAAQFNLSVDAINLLVEFHQQYQDAKRNFGKN
jgi:hypothetical protein